MAKTKTELLHYSCGTVIDVGDVCFIAKLGDGTQDSVGPVIGTQCEVMSIGADDAVCGPVLVRITEPVEGAPATSYNRKGVQWLQWYTTPEKLVYRIDEECFRKFGQIDQDACDGTEKCKDCEEPYGMHEGLDCPDSEPEADEDEDEEVEEEEEETEAVEDDGVRYKVGDKIRVTHAGDFGPLRDEETHGPGVGTIGIVITRSHYNDSHEAWIVRADFSEDRRKQGKGGGYSAWNITHSRVESVESEDSMADTKAKAPATVLSGEAPTIVRQGRQLILPEGMTNLEGIEWLKRREVEDKTKVAVRHEFGGCYPLDALVAVTRAMGDIYGWVANVTTPPKGFFDGPEPPTMFTVKTGPAAEDFMTVPYGSFQIPGLRGRLEVTLGGPKGRQPNLFLVGEVAQGDMEQVKKIITRAEERLVTSSIYRGKAVKVSWRWQREGESFNIERDSPQFLDLASVDPSDLVFSEQVQEAIEVGLYTPVEQHEACRKNGIPLKRGILLEGPPGTGKTLLALVSALKATANGWTFVYLDDVRDLRLGLQLASQYAKAVVFAEDLDRVISGDRDADMDAVLNCLDGVDSKGQEILTIVTTNHVDAIIKPALRPGRIDMILSTRTPDAKAAARLVQNYGRGLLSPTANLEKVGEMLDGKIPAVIREVVERSKMAAIKRLKTDKIKGQVMGEDLVAAARSMEAHARLLAETETKPMVQTLNIPLTVVQQEFQLPQA